MKEPCYTCGEAKWSETTRQILLRKAIEHAKEIAANNKFTGFMAIVERANKTGFMAWEASRVDNERHTVEQLIHFDNGSAIQ